MVAAATLTPFAIGTDADIADLATMASQCATAEARVSTLGTSPALSLDVNGLHADQAKASCLFGKIAEHRFSTEFGFVGNAPR